MLMPIRAHLIDVTAPTKDGTPAKKAKKMERSGLHDERHGLRHFDGAQRRRFDACLQKPFFRRTWLPGRCKPRRALQPYTPQPL